MGIEKGDWRVGRDWREGEGLMLPAWGITSTVSSDFVWLRHEKKEMGPPSSSSSSEVSFCCKNQYLVY